MEKKQEENQEIEQVEKVKQPEVVKQASSKRQLAENEIRLSDGRIVEIRTLKGSDELRINEMLSNDKATNVIGFQNKMQFITMLHAIAKIDGEPVARPFTLKECYDLAEKFSTKDTSLLAAKYMKMNSVGEALTSE